MVLPNIKFIVPDLVVAQKQIEDLAREQHWKLWEMTQQTPNTNFEIMWADLATDTSIHYREDDFLGVNYLMVLGKNYEKVAKHIRERVQVVTRSEMIELAAKVQSEEELGRIVEGVACTASSEFDKELFAIVERAAQSQDKATRYSALIAIGYIEWPEFQPLVEQIALHDSDEQNQKNAQGLLQTLKEIWSAPPTP